MMDKNAKMVQHPATEFEILELRDDSNILGYTVPKPELLVEASPVDKLALDFKVIKSILLAIARVTQANALETLSQSQLDSSSKAPSIPDINDLMHLLYDEIENIGPQDMENIGSQDMENKTDAEGAVKARLEVIHLVVTAAVESKKAAVEIKKAAFLSMEAATKSATASKETAEASKHTVEASNRAAEAATQSAIASKETAEASKYTAEAAKDSREASTQNTKETQVQGAKLTVFTVITTVFTPLNFLTSYLGMNLNDMRSTTWTQQQFWALTAPIALAILVFVLVVAFKYQWVTRLFTWGFRQLPTHTTTLPQSSIASPTRQASSTSTSYWSFTAADREEGARDSADIEAQSTRVIWSETWPWKLLR